MPTEFWRRASPRRPCGPGQNPVAQFHPTSDMLRSVEPLRLLCALRFLPFLRWAHIARLRLDL